jgi:hypothetical protein
MSQQEATTEATINFKDQHRISKILSKIQDYQKTQFPFCSNGSSVPSSPAKVLPKLFDSPSKNDLATRSPSKKPLSNLTNSLPPEFHLTPPKKRSVIKRFSTLRGVPKEAAPKLAKAIAKEKKDKENKPPKLKKSFLM